MIKVEQTVFNSRNEVIDIRVFPISEKDFEETRKQHIDFIKNSMDNIRVTYRYMNKKLIYYSMSYTSGENKVLTVYTKE